MISDHFLRKVLRSDSAVALTGDLFRGLAWLGAVLLDVYALGMLAASWAILKLLHFNDFGKFYYSARFFLDGQNMYGPDPATRIPVYGSGELEFLNMNPPHFHLLLLPLAHLSITQAFVVWAVVSLMCLAVSVKWILRETGYRMSVSGALVGMFAGIVFAGTRATAVTGQLTFLLLVAVTAAWVAARHEKWAKAAGYLGVLISIKPFLAVFVVYGLATRRWRFVLLTAASAVAALAAGVSVFGLQSYADWLQALRSVSWLWPPMNGSLPGVFARTFVAGPIFTPLVEAPVAVRVLTLAAVALIGAITVRTLVLERTPSSLDRGFLLTLLLAELVSPLGWVYYLWISAGPAAAWWQSSRTRPSKLRDGLVWIALPGLFLPLSASVLWAHGRWVAPTLGSAYAWSTLLLWIAAVVDARAANETQSAIGEARAQARQRPYGAGTGGNQFFRL